MSMRSQRTDVKSLARPWPGRLGGSGDGFVAGRLVAALGVVAIGLMVLVIDGHGVSWLAGLIVGGAAGAWIALLRASGVGSDRPAVPRTAAAARAERRTAGAVNGLEQSGWRFLHDVRGRDTTYDHIAVGYGGVILLQSIDPQGTVTMRDGEPFVERRDDPAIEPVVTRLRPRAVADAGAFRIDVERMAGRRLWVQAVVVFWSEFPAGCVTDGRCVYVHGSRLAEWMARRPHQLNAAESDDVFGAVALLAEHGGDLPLPLAV
ncbi:MAG TPA: NERD domain-containing protein [Solirubrobacteraceae bacterium]